MKRPGFKRVIAILIIGYAIFWVYKAKTYTPPEHPKITRSMPVISDVKKKYPLVVFSHGYMGCPKQSVFLTHALAKKGYIVLAPRHRDATCGDEESNKFLVSLGNLPTAQKTKFPLMKPDLWSEEAEQDRLADIRYTLDMALKDPELSKLIDRNQIGLMGHSLGGYTVLGMAGAWKSWKDDRVKSVIAFTPYVPPLIAKQALKNIDVPVMYQSGTADWMTPAWLMRTAYYQNAGEKYYVEFKEAGHFSWMDLGDKTHRADIIKYSVAFFNHTLKGEDEPVLKDKENANGISYLQQSK